MNYHFEDSVTLEGIEYRLTSHNGARWWMTEQAFEFVADRILLVARCKGEADYCKNSGLDLFLAMRNGQVIVKYQKKSSKVDLHPVDEGFQAEEIRRIQAEEEDEQRKARAR